MPWTVKFFQTTRGQYPVQEFIDAQNEATHAKAVQLIKMLIDNGPLLKPPYIKKLYSKLYELRGSGAVAIRIFYTVYSSEYYLLHAFKKKSQKTPTRELKTAVDRMKELIALR